MSDLLECHVHHGSVSCLFVQKVSDLCTSWLCILPVCAKSVRLMYIMALYLAFVHTHKKKCQTYWNVICIMALYLACLCKKVSDLLECHVHHGSVSCLFVKKKGKDFLECHVHHSSVSCLFGQTICQTYWNVMYIMALYLACLCKKKCQIYWNVTYIMALYLSWGEKKSVRLFGMSCTEWLCILPVWAKKVSDLLESHVYHGLTQLITFETDGLRTEHLITCNKIWG